jgi:hypothetical protein
MDDRINVQWKARYKRLGFTKEQIKYYENAPMADRKAEWRALDEMVTADLMRSASAYAFDVVGPQVISDSLPGVKSMADGKTYDSKSQLYDSYKRHDVHIVEKGEQDISRGGYKDRLTKADLSCRKELKEAIQQHLGG